MEIKVENCFGIKDKDGKFYGLVACPVSMGGAGKIMMAFDKNIGKEIGKELFVFGMNTVTIEYE